MSARGYIFEGSLYMERYASGIFQPMVGPLEGTRCAIKANVDRKEMISRGKGTFGQVLESVNIQQPADFSITLTEGTPEVMAMGLMGSVAALSQTSGTFVDDPVTVGELDKWYPLSKAALGAAIIVQDDADIITYVENVDYILNRDLGLLKALSTGSIVATDTLHVDGPYEAISGSKISGANTPDLRVRFTLDGRNLADGANAKLVIREAVLAPDDVIEFLSGEFIGVPMSGRMKTPVGFTDPFYLDLRTPA